MQRLRKMHIDLSSKMYCYCRKSTYKTGKLLALRKLSYDMPYQSDKKELSMEQTERRTRLIKYLLEERNETISIPSDEGSQKRLLRALLNVRPPMPVSAEFLSLQDEYLTERKYERGIADVKNLVYSDGISLFKGDITTLNADVIVNAANSAMLGCFHPLHNCIDNAIHTFAGVQVRLDCNDIMKGTEAENGEVIVTKAYNLPSRFIFHTVGPVVCGRVTKENKSDLAKCYRNCLSKADEMKLKSIAFCCISTGVFGYPKEEAAMLAVKVVREYKAQTASDIKVIFDVFEEEDYELYRRILGKNR